jgi:transcriptional regulator with XRE-family HTH domain
VNIESSHISKIIRERRRELGVSQADLARLSALSLHGLSDIETGKGNPTLQTLLNPNPAIELKSPPSIS